MNTVLHKTCLVVEDIQTMDILEQEPTMQEMVICGLIGNQYL